MHGFGHVAIPTTNFARAKRFFGKVFGWTFTDVPDLGYVLFRAGEPPNGSLYLVKSMPKKPQVNVYVEVEDIDLALKAIRRSRGKVVLGRTPVMEMGWMAHFATPDGCYLSLWQQNPATAQQPR
jgi:predicted enzyme related to lactoylglutathione lyase